MKTAIIRAICARQLNWIDGLGIATASIAFSDGQYGSGVVVLLLVSAFSVWVERLAQQQDGPK